MHSGDATDSALPHLELRGHGLRLRTFTEDDVALIEEAATDSHIPEITSVPAVCTPESAREFIERQVGRRVSGEGWSLAIVDDAHAGAIGQIGLWVGNLDKGRAELGYWVAPSRRGAGAAGRALTLLSDWALEHLDVSRLSLFIEPWNLGSISTAVQAGFASEGVLKSWERVGGVSKDMLSFARLRHPR